MARGSGAEVGKQPVPAAIISNYTSQTSDFRSTQLWIQLSRGDKLRRNDRERVSIGNLGLWARAL
jgi:hypothetical protein